MKKLLFVLFFSLMLCQSVYAGEWKKDETGIRYLQDDGTYKTGWYQDFDEKWYYFDVSTGYMLTNSQTPDGFTVDDSGVWIEERGMIADLSDYDNCVELQVSTPKGKLMFYEGPIKVHYNNRYKINPEGYVNVLSVALSKEGVPYIQFSTENVGSYITVEMMRSCRFTLSDGSIIDLEKTTGYVSDWSEENYSFMIFSGPEIFDTFNKNEVTSVEVWFNEYIPEAK